MLDNVLLLPGGTGLIGLLPVILILLVPIYIAIKYPTIRMVIGIIQIVLGLLFINGLWWLFGLGLVLGVPLLFLGLIFTLTGYYSKQKQIREERRPVTTPIHEDSMDQLKKLKDLLDAGAISQEEYQDKKKKFLDRI